MLRYGSRRNVSTTTTTTTTEESPESTSERRFRRLRLTLHTGDNGKKEPRPANAEADGEDKAATWKKRNGLIQRERPAGRESPTQHLADMTNGAPERSPLHHGHKVYAVVQRTGSDRPEEVMAREWTVTHLQDEMKYIREVRDSLEKVRERMYGQFGGMQESMQKLSQEMRAANSHQRSLESEVKIRTAAMESFDQMNSSLISANLSLQKSLLENCQKRVDVREEVKSLRSTCEKTREKLKDKERELAAAQAENQTLRLQVQSSQEAGSQALRELSATLRREYEGKLQEEQQKHREEIEKLQAQIDDYIVRLEEAEWTIRTSDIKIAERDQRIIELERLLDCMGKEKSQLQEKLQTCEHRLRLLELNDTTDATVAKRSQELQEEAVDLRERIKHLNDMVFCQQRKVKGMIEEVESLRAQVAQKDMFISELLDRIAIVECENNELEDKLKYFMSIQNKPQEVLETREIGVGCNLLQGSEAKEYDAKSDIECEPFHLHPVQHPPHAQPKSPPQPPPSQKFPSIMKPPSLIKLQSYKKHSSAIKTSSPVTPPSTPQPSSPPSFIQHPSPCPMNLTLQRTLRPNKPPPSRLESSLLRYTPVEYSRILEAKPEFSRGPLPSGRPPDPEAPGVEIHPGGDEVDARSETKRDSSETSAKPRLYTPFMKLMEITAKLNTE